MGIFALNLRCESRREKSALFCQTPAWVGIFINWRKLVENSSYLLETRLALTPRALASPVSGESELVWNPAVKNFAAIKRAPE